MLDLDGQLCAPLTPPAIGNYQTGPGPRSRLPVGCFYQICDAAGVESLDLSECSRGLLTVAALQSPSQARGRPVRLTAALCGSLLCGSLRLFAAQVSRMSCARAAMSRKEPHGAAKSRSEPQRAANEGSPRYSSKRAMGRPRPLLHSGNTAPTRRAARWALDNKRTRSVGVGPVLV